MRTSVLAALPVHLHSHVVAALGDECRVVCAGTPERAKALVATGLFEVVVSSPEFLATADANLPPGPPLVLAAEIQPERLAADVVEAAAEALRRDMSRAAALVDLATLSYQDFVAFSRTRVTRQYLIALIELHGGNVTEAAAAANLERESLHRLLRRHRIRADDFRKPAKPGDGAP